MPRFCLPLLLASVAFLAACDSSSPDEVTAYVLNQGGGATGTVTTWDPLRQQSGRLSTPNGTIRGGALAGQQLYLLSEQPTTPTTGLGLLTVIDLGTGSALRQIEVTTPRGIAVAEDLAYVTDAEGGVTPVTLSTGARGNAVPIGDAPGGIAASGSRVFVVAESEGRGQLAALENGVLTGSASFECASPRDVAADEDGEIWVVCAGRRNAETGDVEQAGSVVLMDGESLEVMERFAFEGETLGALASGRSAAYDAETETLYVLQTAPGVGAADAVLRFGTERNVFEAELALTNEDAAAIGVGGGLLYVARANALDPEGDAGPVTVYDRDGTEVARFTAGAAPVAVLFQAAE